MSLIEHRDPRYWILAKSPNPNRPLIVALGGFSHSISPPPFRRRWLSWQWRANFVEESGLFDLAKERDVNVAFVSSATMPWAPWWRRDWSVSDVEDVVSVAISARYKTQASVVYAWGFSDGATLVHYPRVSDGFSAMVAHSGLAPDYERLPMLENLPPVLLVVGEKEPHRSVSGGTADAARWYRMGGRTCERWVIPGLGHKWSVADNVDMLDWCERMAKENR